MESVIGIIPARGGSKGIKSKNIYPLAGRPLIDYTIKEAIAANSFKRLIVSTDSAEIAEVARRSGAEVPFMRPAELSRDDSPTYSVIEHALTWFWDNENEWYEYMMLLQPTAPLRSSKDIKGAIKHMDANADRADSLVSLCKIDDPHPLKTKKIVNDFALPYFDHIPASASFRRQDLEPAYFLNGAIYLCNIDEMICRKETIGSRTIAYVMPPERSVNIDELYDLKLAEWMIKQYA